MAVGAQGPAEIFEAVGRRVVNYALDGHNAVLLTAGPPGAGKTSVMYGPVARPSRSTQGLVPRACACVRARVVAYAWDMRAPPCAPQVRHESRGGGGSRGGVGA